MKHSTEAVKLRSKLVTMKRIRTTATSPTEETSPASSNGSSFACQRLFTTNGDYQSDPDVAGLVLVDYERHQVLMI